MSVWPYNFPRVWGGEHSKMQGATPKEALGFSCIVMLLFQIDQGERRIKAEWGGVSRLTSVLKLRF